MSNDKAEKGQSVSMKEWSADLLSHGFTRTQLDKLVLDYLVTEGYKDAAEKFVKEAKLKDCETMVDSDSLEKRLKIRRSIEQGDIREAIRLINDPYPELLDSNRALHFRLQQQFVIELIRERKVEEAIEQAQTMLVEKADEDANALEQLERTLALLAYDSPSDSPFGDLLAQAHRQAVASDVNAALNALEHRAAASRLSALVRLLAFVHSELDAKYIRTPRLVDVATGRFDQDGSTGRGSSPTSCGVSSTTVPK